MHTVPLIVDKNNVLQSSSLVIISIESCCPIGHYLIVSELNHRTFYWPIGEIEERKKWKEGEEKRCPTFRSSAAYSRTEAEFFCTYGLMCRSNKFIITDSKI